MKLWRGSKNFCFLLILSSVIGGILGVAISLFFKDKIGVIISLICLFGGTIIFGIQYIAVAKWEESKTPEELEKYNSEFGKELLLVGGFIVFILLILIAFFGLNTEF